MNHLTELQIAELIAASARELEQAAEGSELASANLHAAECPQCGAEVAALRQSLALFREATAAYAGAHHSGIPAWQPPVRGFSLGSRFQPAYWTAAAAAALLAIILPLQMALRHSQPPSAQQPVAVASSHPPSDSDQVLLDEVNRELSESVPSPLDALADPANSSQPSQSATQRTN